MTQSKFLLCVLAWALTGCSATVDYARARVPLLAGSEAVVVTVNDLREGDPAVVGVFRSTLYIPFEVRTERDQPLAEAVKASLVASLRTAGYATEETDDPDALHVQVDLREWSTDGYFGELTLTYDVALRSTREGKERIDAVRSGEATAKYANRRKYGDACVSLFVDVFHQLFAGSELGGDSAVTDDVPAANTCAACKQPLEANWTVCPVCATPR